MSTKQIASSTLWQIASQVTMAALSIVTVKLVVMGLSKELAGEYNTAYGYLQIFGILADFGLYAVSVREVSRAKTKEERERVFNSLIVLRSLILFLSLSAALLFAWAIPQWRGTPLPLGITIASFVPGFTLLAGVLRTVFQVEYRMHYVFVAEVIHRVVTVSLTALLVYLGARRSESVTTYYLFLSVGGIGALVLFLLSVTYASKLMRLRLRWDPAMLRLLLRQAAPYGAAFLCTALYRQFDVTLIGLLRPDHDLQNAYYGFVQRMMDMAYLLPTFLLNSTLPILMGRRESGQDTRGLLGAILLAILLLGSTSFLFASLWARPLVALLTAPDYLSTALQPGSDTALRLLSVSMFWNGIIVFCFYSLLACHRWRPLLGTLGVGVVLSLVLNVTLIPNLGFVGASYTSMITHTVLALALLPQSLRLLPASITPKQLLQWLGYSLLLALFLVLAAPLLETSLLTAFGLILAGIWMGTAAWVTGIQKTFR